MYAARVKTNNVWQIGAHEFTIKAEATQAETCMTNVELLIKTEVALDETCKAHNDGKCSKCEARRNAEEQ